MIDDNDRSVSFGTQAADLEDALHTANQRIKQLEVERNSMHAQAISERSKISQLAADLVDCQDALEGWQVSATMQRAEADELRNTLAQSRELYADREHDLAHEFKRANDAEAERDDARDEVTELRESLELARNSRDAARFSNQAAQIRAQEYYAERQAAIAERNEMSAAVVKLSDELGSASRERDALREQVATLRAACENVADNLESPNTEWEELDTAISVYLLRYALHATNGE